MSDAPTDGGTDGRAAPRDPSLLDALIPPAALAVLIRGAIALFGREV